MLNKKVLSKIDLGSYKKPNPYSKDIIYDPKGQWKYPGQNTRIPGGDITMQGVPYPVYAQPNVGQPQMMQPGQDYNFPGADYVDEFPQMRKGGRIKGLVSMPKPGKKGLMSKKYSRSLDATNKLFTQNYLFAKPKSRKNKVFDPNANYAEGGALLTKEVTCKKCGWEWDAADGGKNITTCHKCGGQGLVHAQKGGYIEVDLDEDEIEEYRRGGFIVEEIDNFQKGGISKVSSNSSDNTRVNYQKPLVKSFNRSNNLESFYKKEREKDLQKQKDATAYHNKTQKVKQNQSFGEFINNDVLGVPTLEEQTKQLANDKKLLKKELKPYFETEKEIDQFINEQYSRPIASAENNYNDGPLMGIGQNINGGDGIMENIFEVVDPSGITSWDDIARSYEKEGMSPNTWLEIAGAIPLLGKAAKASAAGIHIAKYKGLDKLLYNMLPKSNTVSRTLKGAGYAGRGYDGYQVYDEANRPYTLNNMGPKYEEGGASNDYVDAELTPKEIKDLIAQGYVIEELN
jgi:hypothetical protein